MSISFRPLVASDKTELQTHLQSLTAPQRLSRFLVNQESNQIQKYVRALDFARETILGAFDGQHMVGSVVLTEGNNSIEIWPTVNQYHQQNGVIEAFIREAIALAKEKKLKEVTLECSPHDSTMQAIAKNKGFTLQQNPTGISTICHLKV